jgi:hypothetical protein
LVGGITVEAVVVAELVEGIVEIFGIAVVVRLVAILLVDRAVCLVVIVVV